MKNTIFITISLICASVTIGQDSASIVSDISITSLYYVEAYPLTKENRDERTDLKIGHLQLWLYIENISKKSVRVPTVMNDISWDVSERKASLRIGLGKVINPLNKEIVEAESKLGIVELAPGELALIKSDFELRLESTKRIEVTYVVDRFYGGRYKIWSGKLDAVATAYK